MLKRIAFSTVLVVVAFAAGVYVDRQYLLGPQLWLGAVGQSFIVGEHARLQYREAPYAEAQKALESFIEYLNRVRPMSEEWKPGEDPFRNARAVRIEKTLAWSRLALLHERNRNAAAADRAWVQAEALARQGSYRDPSRENLRRIVERADRIPSPPPQP